MYRKNINTAMTKQNLVDIGDIIGAPRNLHKSPTGTPQFPAFNSNLSMQDVRRFAQEQPRVTGVPFNATLGQFTINNIQIPGDARLFLGLIFTKGALETDTFTLTLNNNKIIDNASIQLQSIDNAYSVATGYFQFLQPLTGKDVFKIDLITAGLQGTLQLHYI